MLPDANNCRPVSVEELRLWHSLKHRPSDVLVSLIPKQQGWVSGGKFP
jgi:hypothetical protein